MALIFFRTGAVYALLLISLRLLGKRQLAQMELGEFVLASMAADIAAQPLQDSSISLENALWPLVFLFFAQLSLSHLCLRFPLFRSLLHGRPSFLIKEGQLQPSALRKNRISCDELCENLRERGILSPSLVQYALLETDGSLSVIIYPRHAPLTAEAAGIYAADESYPLTLISEGRVLKDNLQALGYDRRWLEKTLLSRGIAGPQGVYFMSCDRNGQISLSVNQP